METGQNKVIDEGRQGEATMVDIAQAANALNAFIKTSDAVALHKTIMYFDTDVREQFVSVLRYIEENELVPVTEYCVL
jgi:hypothetical protein